MKSKFEKQTCDMCGKIDYVYPVNIDKDLKEKWCRSCIDDEENINQSIKKEV